MDMSGSRWRRRTGVTCNYGFLLIAVLFALAGELGGWTLWVKVSFWLAVALVLGTFFPVHAGTGLWRLVHAGEDTLDEREILLTLGSLRYAYAVFAVIALLGMLFMAVFGYGTQPFRLILFWVMLYLAHTLPSSVIAWSQPRV